MEIGHRVRGLGKKKESAIIFLNQKHCKILVAITSKYRVDVFFSLTNKTTRCFKQASYSALYVEGIAHLCFLTSSGGELKNKSTLISRS